MHQGARTFAITSNTSWNVSDDATWLTVSPASGSGDTNLTATYQENISTSQRVGTITITGGGITRTVTVTQAAAPFILTVSPSNQSVTNISGSTTFAITSNTSWNVSDDATWLTVSPASGSDNSTLTATYQENTTTSQRVGTITVIGGGITRTVTVTQAAAPFILTVSPSNQSVTNASGSTTFTITSNTSWNVSDDATWLTVSPASGTENGAITANYSREHNNKSKSRNDNSNWWWNNQNSNSNTRINSVTYDNTIGPICSIHRRQYIIYNNIKLETGQ